MKDQNIKCPSCGHEFEIEGAIANRVRADLEIETGKERQKIRAEWEKLDAEKSDVAEEVERRLAENIARQTGPFDPGPVGNGRFRLDRCADPGLILKDRGRPIIRDCRPESLYHRLDRLWPDHVHP